MGRLKLQFLLSINFAMWFDKNLTWFSLQYLSKKTSTRSRHYDLTFSIPNPSYYIAPGASISFLLLSHY